MLVNSVDEMLLRELRRCSQGKFFFAAAGDVRIAEGGFPTFADKAKEVADVLNVALAPYIREVCESILRQMQARASERLKELKD